MSEDGYGSGAFGRWTRDEHGLPAYRYTCDQTSDPRAVTPVNEVWRGPTEHTHQVGNDRLVAAVSNYGVVQVRQDEGSPKFLNDVDPGYHQYGGGVGYLTDGDAVVHTYFDGDMDTFERVFGVGYLRKTINRRPYAVDQIIFAPFGDDPLLISQVTITNHGPSPADVRWIEYWGAKQYQFSNRAWMQGAAAEDLSIVPRLRRNFAARFRHSVSQVARGAGLLDVQTFAGRTEEDERRWQAVQQELEANGFFRGKVRAPVPQADMEDLDPPPVFLVSLDGRPAGVSNDGAAFFGTGGVSNPDGVRRPLGDDLSGTGPETVLLLGRRLSLASGESRTLTFAYGYLPDGVELEPLLDRYRDDVAGLWAVSSRRWREDGIRLELDDEEAWVTRELAWHNYYLRSNLTYDSFFQEHIESQGHVYQYLIGFQGAARDQLQHAMPFTFTQPWIVRETIRYTLKEMKPDGEIPWSIVGHGMWMYAAYRPSDIHLWLLWLAAEYVLATRDVTFLDEVVPLYPVYGEDVVRGTVKEHLTLAFRTFVETVSTGRHNLVRLYNGDWNDSAVLGHAPPELEEEVRERAESVLNAAMSIYVMDIFARMLECVGDGALAREAHDFAAAQRRAVQEQWCGRWFRRAWMTEALGWIGEDQLWLEPQPWAIIGEATTPEQTGVLLEAMDELVREPSPIGAFLHSKGVPEMRHDVGYLTNGGVWPSINGTLVWALALVDGAAAWDEYKKNMLAAHAEAYPDIWYGIWSGPDSYNSVLSPYPGHTQFHPALKPDGPQDIKMRRRGMSWTDFPVMNMHPHAWPLYDVPKLFGLEFTAEGLTLAPSLPKERYRFASPLVGLEKEAGRLAGWYAPAAAGEWQISLTLPPEELARYSILEVNGAAQPLTSSGGRVTFRGASAPGEPLVWAIRDERSIPHRE